MPSQGDLKTEPVDKPTGLMGLEFVGWLHAVGDDPASFMVGPSHGAGPKLGLALVFGHLAASQFSGAGLTHGA